MERREKASSKLDESSMDFPRDGLCPEIWQKAIAPDGVAETWLLVPEAEATIGALVDAAIKKTSLRYPQTVHVVGSIASTQWTDACDVDVHLLGVAPAGDAADAASKQLRAAVKELEASGFQTKIRKHPLELYVQGNPFQDLMSAGCYDVGAKRWETGPDLVDPSFNPYGEYMAKIEAEAGKKIAKIRNQIFSLYEMAIVYAKNAGTDFGRNLHKPFADKLDEIAQTYAQARAERRTFSDPQSEEEALRARESEEWKVSNATFKLLDKYGYVPMLRELSQLSELQASGELDEEVAGQALEAIKKHVAGIDELSEKEMFGELEEDKQIADGAFQKIALAALLAIPGILPAAKAEQAVRSVPRAEQRASNPAVQSKLKAVSGKIGKFSRATAANVLAWCLYGEANNQGLDGKKAVASAIWNRAGADPQKLMAVVLKPWQFSTFNADNPWGLKAPKSDAEWKIQPPDATLKNAEELASWNDCVSIAAQLVAGTFKSTIGSRNSYLNKTVAQKKGWSAMKPGGWGRKMSNQLKLKDHTFGYLSNNDGSRKASAGKAAKAGRQAQAKKLDLKSKAKLMHVVEPGDTLWSIAKKYKTTVASIAALNKMKSSSTLKIGRSLRVR